MASDDIRSWLDNMRALGYDEAAMRQSLQEKGWTAAQIDAALASPGPTLAPPVTTPAAVGPAEMPPPTPVVPPPAPQTVIPPPTPGAYVPHPYVPTPYQAPATAPSGLAIAALILGVIALIPFLGILPGILAIVFGIMALAQARPGRQIALAGLIIGAVGLLLSLVWIGLAMRAAHKEAANPTTTTSTNSGDQNSPSGNDQAATPESAPAAQPPAATVEKPAAAPESTDTICLSHEKALMKAIMMYTTDYDSCTPDADHWVSAVAVYMPKQKELWMCPEDSRTGFQRQAGIYTSYTMYEPMGGTYLNSMKQPGLGRAYILFDGSKIAGDETWGAFRHHGGLNLGYADGHCAWVAKDNFLKPGE
jgi:prepilin-type processing-associated H-X9-DG protein